mmetsp:Transcript_34846/g.93046  ORF Transcript_34846/g.93046 Transcript_34846/m.93046 type:complete len:208 (-) Transcript_34846:4-627(-)
MCDARGVALLAFQPASLRRLSPFSHFNDLPLHPPQILRLVSGKETVWFLLGRRRRVGVVQEILDAEQNLPDGDGRLPIFILIQDAQAHRSRRVDVGVEERVLPHGHELALRWLARVVLRELHGQSVGGALPWTLRSPRDAAVPLEHVLSLAVIIRSILRIKSEWVILLEGGALLRQPLRRKAGHGGTVQSHTCHPTQMNCVSASQNA